MLASSAFRLDFRFRAPVRSPHVCRRQALMFGSSTPKTRSMNWIVEPWSWTWLETRPMPVSPALLPTLRAMGEQQMKRESAAGTGS